MREFVSVRRLLSIGALLCGLSLAASAARADPVQLNFATVNQNLWQSGPAFVHDDSISTLPDFFSGSVHLDKIDLDPFSAAIDFLSNVIGINLSTGVSIGPTASFTAGLEAGYHVNSGSINVNYPTTVNLSLPDTVQAGQPFTVSADYPAAISPYSVPASAFSAAQNVFSANPGYSGPVSKYALPASALDFTPVGGVTTVFPYAEAHLNLDLQASGALNLEACAFLLGCESEGLSLGSVDGSQQLFEINTLNGISVLGEPVIPFNATNVPLPLGLGTFSYSSPNITFDKSVDGPLKGVSFNMGRSQEILKAGFDVDQLIPLVGQLLHNNLGVFGYDLLSFEPTVSLVLNQQLTVTPHPTVDLNFSSSVIYNGRPTHTVSVGVGDSVDLLPTVGGVLSGDLVVAPTFSLNPTLTNHTWLSVDFGADVTALQLTAPVDVGPAFSTHLDFGDLGFFDIDNNTFPVYVPSITSTAQSIGVTGGINFLSTSVNKIGDAFDDDGNPNYNLTFTKASGQALSVQAFGQLVTVPPPTIPANNCFVFDIQICETDFLADQDVFLPNADGILVDEGTAFCISHCTDLGAFMSQLFPESTSLPDLFGDPIYYSSLNGDPDLFPELPTPDQVVQSDPVMGQSQFFQSFATTQPFAVPTPEPMTLALVASGLAVMAARKRSVRR
jgi:hypothetical protein